MLVFQSISETDDLKIPHSRVCTEWCKKKKPPSVFRGSADLLMKEIRGDWFELTGSTQINSKKHLYNYNCGEQRAECISECSKSHQVPPKQFWQS